MLILPERGAPRGKVLMPMRPADWRQPSARSRTYGVENVTRFRITARLHDGAIRWRGWFDDREDADAFLLALVRGDLHCDRALWDLPTPAWRPDFGQMGVVYDFATLVFFTTTGTTTPTAPADFNPANNNVDVIGSGGIGQRGGAGGGGGFARKINALIAGGAALTITLTATGSGASSIVAGVTTIVSATGGTNGTDLGAGGAGGSGTVGSQLQNGGAGGSPTIATGFQGGGGGGAGGPNGNGGAGQGPAVNTVGGNGGVGDNASGGAGGAGSASAGATGGTGGQGTEYDASHGSGGGGGGSTNSATTAGNGGPGGFYGGGGAGAGQGGTVDGTGGTGRQALGVLNYAPLSFIASFDTAKIDYPGPAKRSVRGAAIAPKEDGIEGTFTFIANTPFAEGWQVQPVQPPNPGTGNLSNQNARAAAVMRGDDGTQALLLGFFPAGWPIQPWQPPSLPYRKFAAGMFPGDAGGMNGQPSIIGYFPYGFSVQPPQPPTPVSAPHVRGAAIMRGEDGNEDLLRRFFPMGFPVQPPQPPHPQPERRAAAVLRGDDGTQFTFIRFFQIGWPVQPPQPPHPIPERRAGAIMRWEDGTEKTFVPPAPNVSWETVPNPGPPLRWPRRQIAGAIMRGPDGTDLPFFYPFYRYEAVLPTLRRWPRPTRMPTVGEPGIEAPFPRPVWGWKSEIISPERRKIFREIFQATTLVEFPAIQINAAAFYFDAAEFVRSRRRVSAVELEPAFVPLPRFIPWGYDHHEALAIRRKMPHLSIDEALIPFLPRITWGFERAPEALRRPMSRFGASFVVPNLIIQPTRVTFGWDFAHADLRKRANRYPLFGAELVSKFPPVWTSGWEIQPWQPPRFGRWRAGALMRGDDGSQGTIIIPLAEGWQTALFWPPHPRPERSGGIMLGDIGGAWGPFVYLVPSEAIADDAAVWLAAAYDIGLPPPEFQEG